MPMKFVGQIGLPVVLTLIVTFNSWGKSIIDLRPEMYVSPNGELLSGAFIAVDDDGYARFDLNVIENANEAFFEDHHLHINFPYRVNGRKKNNIIEFSGNGSVEVELWAPELKGELLEFGTTGVRPLESSFVRATTPVLQFCVLNTVIGITSGAFNNIKEGGFHEGMQWYFMLDGSLRFIAQAAEHLEVFIGMDPDTSHLVTAVMLGSALYIVDSNIDADSLSSALASTRSGFYSALAGQLFEAADEALLTPYVSEYFFPSKGSERSFENRLTSQLARGPVTVSLLKQVPGKPPFIVKKLLIKSVSELRQFGGMIGEGFDNRGIEWLLNGGIAAYSGPDVQKDSMERTFRDELQQQLGSHTHKQLVPLLRPANSAGAVSLNPIIQSSYAIASEYATGLMLHKLFGALVVDSAGGNKLLLTRWGKGLGISMMVGSTAYHVVVPFMSSVSEQIYHQISDDYVRVKSLFRRDRLIEIGHWIYGTEPEKLKYSPLRSSPIRDEL